MSETMARKPPERREPGEMTEFDLDLLGRSAVRLNIPVQNVAETLEVLRKVRLVVERSIVKLEAGKIADDRHTLVDVKLLLRQCAMAIGKVKRRRF